MTHVPENTGAAPATQAGDQRSFVRFHLQGSAATRNMKTPTVKINGYAVPASYGENYLEVHPGRNEVSASAQWLREYGQASYVVDVPPGGVVDVWYSCPMSQFQKGTMGPAPQKTGGVMALWTVLALAAVLIVLVTVLGI
jgi:hypothetical protein